MGPKKGGAEKKEGEEEDISCEQLFKAYFKNCKSLACESNK
jgi:hypothetical protein